MSLLDRTFDSEYEIMFSAWGEGVLKESDLLDMQKPDAAFEKFREEHGRAPESISLSIEDPRAAGMDYGYTGVDAALLEKLDTLKELILPDSIKSLALTPKLREILKRNKTLIRGSFDSFAESFAKENGLNFRPADCVFAYYFFEPAQEGTTLSLIFRRDGKVFVKEDISSPGSSAGNTFGGVFYHKLMSDFFKKQTAEQVAKKVRSALYDTIINDGRLAAFIEKAKERPYFVGKN